MAQFQINPSVPITDFCFDSGQKKGIVLQLEGGDASGKPLEIGTMNTDLIKISVVSQDKGHKLTTFRVEPLPKAKGLGSIFARPQGGGATAALLRITVGVVTNQTSSGSVYKIDLIADLLGRSDDPIRVWVYQRILSQKNNTLPNKKEWQTLLADQPLKQNTDMSPGGDKNWNCGTAARQFGVDYFGKSNYGEATTLLYYPPKTTKMADIKFNQTALRNSINRLNEKLAKGIAVRVFAVHDDGFKVENGVIQATNLTHFITIVGAGPDNEYMTTDPWPTGSRSIYTSGIFGNVDCPFMGRLKYYGNQLSTHPNDRGGHQYLVLMGP